MRRLLLLVLIVAAASLVAQGQSQTDTVNTSAGELRITFLGHGTLMFHHLNLVVDVDPVSQYADFARLPKADVIFVTHEHPDHLDPQAIEAVRKPDTTIVGPARCAQQVAGMKVMTNGDTRTLNGLPVEAVPAYNIVHKRPNGQPFHARGEGNGYVITFANKRVYVAGDTENIPEMKGLQHIDIAFLPMNLPFTMTPEMVAAAAKSFSPKILYPYHYGDTDTSRLTALMAGSGIEVRIRNMR